MEVSTMRAILRKQYRGADAWVQRVNKMSDAQVMAIYYRMLSAGKLSRT